MNTTKRKPAGRKNINKLPNGAYRVRIQKNGESYDKCFQTLKVAKMWRDSILEQVTA